MPDWIKKKQRIASSGGAKRLACREGHPSSKEPNFCDFFKVVSIFLEELKLTPEFSSKFLFCSTFFCYSLHCFFKAFWGSLPKARLDGAVAPGEALRGMRGGCPGGAPAALRPRDLPRQPRVVHAQRDGHGRFARLGGRLLGVGGRGLPGFA